MTGTHGLITISKNATRELTWPHHQQRMKQKVRSKKNHSWPQNINQQKEQFPQGANHYCTVCTENSLTNELGIRVRT
jgi:hypothetical protein